MHEKNSTTLCGVLMRPLAIGRCAVMFSQGRFVRTAPVSTIHSCHSGAVRFATLDADYTLLLDPPAQSASITPALAA